MKKIILSAIVVCFAVIFLAAQSKRDYTWVLGYSDPSWGSNDPINFGGQFLNFADGKTHIEKFAMQYGPATGVANDESGNLLFYTTGCKIISKNYELMENGDAIDSGADNTENCPYGGVLYVKNGTFVLPDGKDVNRYNIFYLRISRTSDTSNLVDRLYSARIDIAANNGLGRVEEKTHIVLDDSLHNQVAVTRHGNGRDWWIIVPRGVGREFWQILVTPDGLLKKRMVNVQPPQPSFSIRIEDSDNPGIYSTPNEYAWEAEATAAFSPDGSKYCVAILGTGFEIYDFDRCSGDLTFRRLIPIPPYKAFPNYEVQVNSVGAAFSPNSRYLYYNNGESMYQLDVCENCIDKAVPSLLGSWDGYSYEGIATNFFNMRNAPDGKIYINSTSSAKTLHVINNPDKKGLSCNFQQHALEFPYWNVWILNNFPNFNLYDLPGSACDTLGIDDLNRRPVISFEQLKIYPNPANQMVNMYIPTCESGRVRIWNLAGQLMDAIDNITGNEVYTIKTANWPAGIYIFDTNTYDQGSMVNKVLIAH